MNNGLVGMKKSEMDRVEPESRASRPLRPRDAATLLLLDRSGRAIRVLMGRRRGDLVFMPGKLVFPGGRTDPGDSRVAVVGHLHPAEQCRITGAKVGAARARAIALSAVRETYEEAGLLIGKPGDFSGGGASWQAFREHAVQPSLSSLRFVARAITPPGRVRRYDTRFFAAWRDEVAVELPGGGPAQELEALEWLDLDAARAADVPSITRSILEDVAGRLADDPDLSPGGPVPFYRMHNRTYVRTVI